MTLCDCGLPLHYQKPESQAAVEFLIKSLGALLEVRMMDGHGYWVPRHYIALHGLAAKELPALAKQYGWKETD